MHRPIWFDIDGTLVHTAVGIEAFRIALRDVYGWEDTLEQVRFAGNTDLGVLMQLSEHHSGDAQAGLDLKDSFFERMAALLDEGLAQQRPQVIPGAANFLKTLVKVEEVGLYLLTGNARACAFHKLRHADLHEPFTEGGFGDEHADRNVLARRSQERLRQARVADELHAGWVIGDTPRDVHAALSIGARAVGVASGSYSADQLLAAGATAAVEDLIGAAELIDLLLAS